MVDIDSPSAHEQLHSQAEHELQHTLESVMPLAEAMAVIGGHARPGERLTPDPGYAFNIIYGTLITRPGKREFYDTVPLGLTDVELNEAIKQGRLNPEDKAAIEHIKEQLPALVTYVAQELDVLPKEIPPLPKPGSFEEALGMYEVDQKVRLLMLRGQLIVLVLNKMPVAIMSLLLPNSTTHKVTP